MDAARNAAFAGRATHLAAFRDALTGGAAAVLFIHGPGGVGKTSLLRRYADEARSAGRHVIALDGRDLLAFPEGLLVRGRRRAGRPHRGPARRRLRTLPGTRRLAEWHVPAASARDGAHCHRRT
ncbi:AAA family ATPase [Nonomuraea jabiensis]|uniref:AAA family ATPase n=1 Tax=Nonomuraea jabiensis TaxID=882448 RepID=UPI0036A1C7EE